ncbi:MAG: type II secretion system F family protein [Candidatus Nanoarchaeia archaeon]|nr:type II secretion system F family protein [Candidatus Nanoarchaeia archaeon]MDD5239349.1 type II secretion system F family protein [Candidatus Nanoarchaeia archaeon]
MNDLLEKIGRMIARDNIVKIRAKLNYAGLKVNAESFVAITVMVGVLFSIAAAVIFYFWLKNPIYPALALIGAGVTFYFLMSGIIGLLVDNRAKFVEKTLPDALLLMASNLKSGVAPDEALILSAKSEFGFLAKNIKTAGHKIATGIPIEQALETISEDVDSEILNQTIGLIIEGISSGGELASILEGTARDIKDNEIIRKEIRAIIMLYATFIMMAVTFISPILYAVSTELAGILSSLSQTLAAGFLVEGSSSVVPIAAADISTDFLLVFAYVNIIITGVFGSMMIALINKGNEKYGLKYMPFIVGAAIILFNVGRLAMKYFFGSIRIL